MIKQLSTIALVASSSLSFAGTKEEVTKILQQHFSAIKDGKMELLNKSWDIEQATITEIRNNKVKKQDLKKTFAMWTKNKNPGFEANIKSITEVADSIAVAKVAIYWKDDMYSDALTLVKGNEGWKIISKVYQAPKVAKSSYGL